MHVLRKLYLPTYLSGSFNKRLLVIVRKETAGFILDIIMWIVKVQDLGNIKVLLFSVIIFPACIVPALRLMLLGAFH